MATKNKPKAEPQIEQPEPEPVRPMAAPEPTMTDRIMALELANIELENRISKMDTFMIRVARDHSYQYGGTT